MRVGPPSWYPIGSVPADPKIQIPKRLPSMLATLGPFFGGSYGSIPDFIERQIDGLRKAGLPE